MTLPRLIFTVLIWINCFHASASGSQSVSTDANIEKYLDLLNQYPNVLGPWGDSSKKEIEIVRDPQIIAEITKSAGQPVGIVAQGKYWFWLNDPVKFSSNKFGVFGRLLWNKFLKGVPGGVAVLVIQPNGRIVLNYNYRHTTRSWELELPRGGSEVGETVEQTAIRETKEETGMVIHELHLLGKMTPDTGVLGNVVSIFLAKVDRQEQSEPEDTEAIAAILTFSLDEIKQGLINGYLSFELDGEIRQAPLRDPFLTYAVLLAQLKQLL